MENILLVEDEQINMDIMYEYLRDAGYNIDKAYNGHEALLKLNKNKNYSVVITDRKMPKMDGIELYMAMQEDEILASIPVIMQTASNSPEEVDEGISAGVYYYLVKPYKRETLVSLVSSAIRDRLKYTFLKDKMAGDEKAIQFFTNGEMNIQTMEDARYSAILLGNLFKRPDIAAAGLYELLVNAIEHGNLKIGYQAKNDLMVSGNFEKEIERRMSLPENAKKKVNIKFINHASKVELAITDEGEGFDAAPFMQIEPHRATRSNGRGIAKAKMLSFDKIQYSEKGNQVAVAEEK